MPRQTKINPKVLDSLDGQIHRAGEAITLLAERIEAIDVTDGDYLAEALARMDLEAVRNALMDAHHDLYRAHIEVVRTRGKYVARQGARYKTGE